MSGAPNLIVAARRLAATPVALLYRLAGDTRSTSDADVAKWAQRNHVEEQPTAQLLPVFLEGWPEFRNVFYYRLERVNPLLKVVVKFCRRVLRPQPFLEISCPDIGPGLVIAHGFGTILNAQRVGQNFWIHHQVTIGWNHSDDPGSANYGNPIIGDDVFIGTGAKIFGPITIGDGAKIGANAVVVRDVPPRATAVGVPAKLRLAPDVP
jgi:serine O-acetyltransferase